MLFKTLKRIVSMPLLFLLLLLLAACGGGGGSSSSSDRVEVPGSTGATGANTVTAAKSSLQFDESTPVVAELRNADNSPAVGVPVNFTTTLGTLTPASGTGITDSQGRATIALNAGTRSGKGQILASATVGSRVVNLSTLFDVLLPQLEISEIVATGNSSAVIDYGSSQGITVKIVDAKTKAPFVAQGVPVVFSSTQVQDGNATISSPVTSVNGEATATYKAVTATGTDTITASIPGFMKSVTLSINPLRAGSISFVSAQPATIGLKGMGGGGVQESSRVTFKVLDTTGQPMPNRAVSFALNTTVGGLSLSAASGSTAADGTVSTIVQAGIVATPVRVTASTTVGTEVLSTQSDTLVVSTGVAAQDGFSISLSDLNPETYSTDGIAVDVTARLSDHFHNPVPDGTAVYFTTSGGSIAPSCVTSGGACTVTWRSQDPRPADTTGALRTGRAVILAYAVGEEAFLDLNGNGVADPTDRFWDDSEAFRDDDEDGFRDSTETFIDFDGDRTFDLRDGAYNGVLQGSAFSTAPKSKHVFSNSVLVMSSSDAIITFTTAEITAPGSYAVRVTDRNGNTMPSGTTIAITAPFGTLTGKTSHVVPLNIGYAANLVFHIAASGSPRPQSGLLTVTVTSPAGLVTTNYLPINGTF